jgi:hypothetical protein
VSPGLAIFTPPPLAGIRALTPALAHVDVFDAAGFQDGDVTLAVFC